MTQAQIMAEDFDRTHHDVLQFVSGCTDTDWRAATAEEGWPVAAAVVHIADGYTTMVEWAQAYLAGRQVTTTRQDIDAHNAVRVEPARRVTRQEALELLGTRALLVRELVSELTDEQLVIAMPFGPAGGREISLGQLPGILVAHTRRHLTSARAGVSAG